MIKPGEVQQKASFAGVRDQQIEKDYIISWILFGISRHHELSNRIVFKGGTVLKKVYFVDYRFSEDLDFTLWNEDNWSTSTEDSNNIICSWFKEVFEFIKDEANIQLDLIENNKTVDINFYISYVGPLGGQGNNKKVKVDISCNEQLIFKPIMKNVFVGYSDLVEYALLCYSLEEVLVEKMRAVMQRMQARDFYDIWYLLEKHGMEIAFYKNEFQIKCESKSLDYSDFLKKIYERSPQYRGRWKSSLSEQIKDLPDIDQVERAVHRHLKKLKF